MKIAQCDYYFTIKYLFSKSKVLCVIMCHEADVPLSCWYMNAVFPCVSQFDRSARDDGRVSEKDFGSVILTYAGLPDSKKQRMLKRVKKKFHEEAKVSVMVLL